MERCDESCQCRVVYDNKNKGTKVNPADLRSPDARLHIVITVQDEQQGLIQYIELT